MLLNNDLSWSDPWLSYARPHRTGYPFAPAWAFASDKKWEGIFRICEKGLRNSVHETFVDCPYYEQMQYVGDTRVQALTWLAITGDVRPVQRALELFDRSRWFNGFVAERCPSSPVQMSATYSLIQPLMLRDFCYWANEPAVVKRLLTGTRCALENAVACLDDTGLPSNLPGWLFVDWVKTHGWGGGNPLGDEPVLSAPVALHLPLGLQAAAEVEALVGDAQIAARWREMAAAVLERIFKTYWNSEYKILADNREHSKFSEHAQALALACDGVPGDYRRGMEAGLINSPVELARASVYFSFYVHDALLRSRQADAVIDRFAFWDHLEAQGFLTTVE
ncbi:MAG TPA: hypothetical protein VJ952_07440, partial [Opitutales bacterium]|nr:hypothetical protein [Opitutales bacterium]